MIVTSTVYAMSPCKGENKRSLFKPLKWHKCIGSEKIDNGKYAELNVHPSGDYFFKLPEDLRNKIPTYIKENINLERFINA